MGLGRRPRKLHITLESDVYVALTELVRQRGGRRAGVSLSGELNQAAREYLARTKASSPLGVLEESIDRVLLERLTQLETWLQSPRLPWSRESA